MPRKCTIDHPPRITRGSRGRAVVRIDGKCHYVGKFGTPEAYRKGGELVARWIVNGGRLDEARPEGTITVAVIAERRLKRLEQAGGLGVGSDFVCAVRALRGLYGSLPAVRFGVVQGQTLIASFIQSGYARATIQKRWRLVRDIFQQGVQEGLIEPSVLSAINAVKIEGGKSAAHRPAVNDEDFAATLPHMPPVVRDMARLQRYTGMRSGELVGMTARDIDTSGDVWTYMPEQHKSKHRGKRRVVVIGPKGQEIVGRYLQRDLAAPLFSPRESERKRLEVLRERRTSHPGCNMARDAERAARGDQRPLKSSYGVDGYRQSIIRACGKAGVAVWTPHALRKAAATEARERCGLDAASMYLDHSGLEVTAQHYAERSLKVKAEVARKIG